MSRDSSFDDVDGEVCNWRSSLSASDYEETRGRGKVIKDVNYRNKLKLASEVIGIQEKVTPLGYMPTTQEMLNERDVNEITPLLRQLGISGQGEDMSSRKTRKVAVEDDDIRIEGNVPIILNSQLFAMINSYSDETAEAEDESYDPNLPLHEQFRTIKEFAVQVKEIKNEQRKPKAYNIGAPKTAESLSSSSLTSEKISSLSSSVCDESSSSSNNNMMWGGSDEDSNDEMFQPLLEKKQQLYTPRQLYDLKKLYLKQIISKGYSHQPVSQESCKPAQ